MDENLKAVLCAFQAMVETCQLLVRHLNREQTAHNQTLTQLGADLSGRVRELEIEREAHFRQYPLATEHMVAVAPQVRALLTALKGAMYILLCERPTDPETRRALLKQAYDNAERLMDLMQATLDLVR